MRTHATTTTRTSHNGKLAAVRRAALLTFNRRSDRLTQQTDGNNNATRFQYGDPASGLTGLLVKIIYPTLSQDFKYDQRNRITQTTDSATGTLPAGTVQARINGVRLHDRA